MATEADLPSEEEVLRQTLAALEMPTEGLRQWFQKNRKFCDAHGGRRIYGELLSLLDACESALDGDKRADATAPAVTPTGDDPARQERKER